MDRAPGLTDQQAGPLAVIGASVALSAGAGCGKTRVLTARFLGDLDGDGRRPLREIVALTFTEKAARELRQRIRDQCRARLADGEDPAHWRAVLRGLEAAPIGTFHEFCVRWLRRHAIEAKIDPDFAVLDEAIAGTVRDEALGKCLLRWLAEGDADLIDLAVEYGLRRVRESLADLLARRSLGEIDEWVARTPDDLIALWRESWTTEGRKARLHKVVQSARACVERLTPHESTHPKMIERRAFLLEHLPGLEHVEPPDARLGEVLEMARVQGGGTKNHWPSPEVYEGVRKSFEGLRDAIKDFLDKIQWDEVITREAAEHGLRFARLAAQARREYDAAKRARGKLDFDDLILKTRALLRQRAEGTPAEAITRLLVDEFQDTDPVQSDILERLVGDAFGRGRLFLVGDVKQSIYGFRGAQPGLFEDFRERFPADGRLELNENFRSVPGVLDFVNALFAGAFGHDSRLFPKVDAPGDQPAVEFLWAVEADEEEPAARANVSDRRKVEGRWIARRLRQVIDSGRMVRDPKSQQARPVEPRDVVLLFRAMTDTTPYESALDEEGFDYYVMGGAAFYVQQEVHDLINLLSVIEDPRDAVSMAGALRSPFFCLSDEGLFWLSTSKHGDLAEGLERVEEIDELTPLDRRQAMRARELLRRWRATKDRVSIAALVDGVLAESGYEPALLGESLGARKRANVRKLVRQARELDQQGGFTIAEFVRRLRADLRRTPREEQAATTDEEGSSIRLMSIHQAKGLEFPIVVLPDLNRKPPGDLDAVAFHPTLGPLVRPSKDQAAEGDGAGNGQSLGWLTYQAIERRDEEAEALRLFYVATTRARDVLILSAGLGPAENALSPAMHLLHARFDRQTGECRVPLPDGWSAPRVSVTRECPPGGVCEGGVFLPPSPLAGEGRGGGAAEDPFGPVPRVGPDHPPPQPSPARGEGGRGGPPQLRRAVWRPPLVEIAQTIAAIPPPPETCPPPAAPRPRFVDLDPARGLSPRAARLDRLIRTILADPKSLQPGQLPAVAARSARRQDPLASPSLVAEALDQLRPWLEGPFGRELAAATAIERDLAWTVAWPPDSADPTVFQGRLDLFAQDRQGAWRLVQVSDSTTSEVRERLRLVLSAHAATALGYGPIHQAWSLQLGPAGRLQGEERLSPDDIEAAVRESMNSMVGN